MSTGPVATASVKIVPDLTGFQALLQSEVNKAVAGVKVPAIKAMAATNVAASGIANASVRSSGGTSAAGRAAAAETKVLANESNALRGALIGLSRVTPVTVFGLGAIGTAAIAAGLAIKGAVNSAAALEQQLNVFQAVTSATDSQMKAVSATAQALGADLTLPATSATDAATAMTELAKAGLSVNDSLAAAKGVLQLAAAANLSAGQAAQFTATQLNAFKLPGSEATHVTDLLAGAANAAQGEISDFGAAFQQVSAVAAQIKLPLDQTTGLLTELAKAGLRGADGGTSLRTTLLRLVPTTKQAAEYVKALGIEMDNSKPAGEQIVSLIEQYRVALLKLNPIQRQETLTQIFGQDAIRAASIIFSQNAHELERLTAQVSRSGSGAELAQARMKGFSGSVEGLKSSAQTLGTVLAQNVLPTLTEAVKTLSAITNTATDAASALASVGDAIKPVTSALGGSTTVARVGLAAAAGLGIKTIVSRIAAHREAAAAATQAEKTVATAAVESAAIQVAATKSVIQGNMLNVASLQKVAASYAGSAAAAVSANKVINISNQQRILQVLRGNAQLAGGALGLGLTAAGSQVPGITGSVLSSAGAGAIVGSFFPGPGTAIGLGVGAFVGFLRAASQKDAADRAKVKAEWNKLTYSEQQAALRKIDRGIVPSGTQGLQTIQDIALAGSRGFVDTFGLTVKPNPFNAVTAGIVQTTVAGTDPFAGYVKGGSQTPSKAFSEFVKILKARAAVLPGAKAAAALTVKGQIELQIALARMTGSTAQLQDGLTKQIKYDKALVETLQTKLNTRVSGTNKELSGFLYSAKERAAFLKQIEAAVGEITGAQQEIASLAQSTPFTVSTGAQIAQINAGATKSLIDNLNADRAVAAEIQRALTKELAKKKKDKDAISSLRIQLAQANATVTNDLAAIQQQNLDAANQRRENAAKVFAAAAAQRQLARDLRRSVIETALSAAQLTVTNKDDIAAYNRLIQNDKAEIKRNQRLARLAKEKGQSGTTYLLAVQAAIRDINAQKANIKNALGGGSGFTLPELFAEAQKTFNEFASNVSTGISTPGSIRGAFSATIISQKDKLTQLEQQKLAEAAKTNDILAQILAAINGGSTTAAGNVKVYDPIGPADFASSAHARSFHNKTG